MVMGTTWILILSLSNNVGNVLIDISAPGAYHESVIGQGTIMCLLQHEVGYRERIQFYILFLLLTWDNSIKITFDTTKYQKYMISDRETVSLP